MARHSVNHINCENSEMRARIPACLGDGSPLLNGYGTILTRAVFTSAEDGPTINSTSPGSTTSFM